MSEDNTAQLEKIDSFVKEKLQDDLTGHDYAHIQRVVKMAKRLIDDRTENVNQFVVFAAGYLHDVIDEKLVENQAVAENEVARFLRSLGVSDFDIAHIFDIITHMSFSDNLGQINYPWRDRLSKMRIVWMPSEQLALPVHFITGVHMDIFYMIPKSNLVKK